jgi:HSP20 family protein
LKIDERRYRMNIVLRRPSSALIGFNPYYRPLSLFDEIEDIAAELWNSWKPEEFGFLSMIPRTEMYEDKGELVVKTEIPGIKEEDLDISIEGTTLTIKAEKKEEEVREDADYHVRERQYGHYFRSTELPYNVKSEKIKATLENGVLELRLLKVEEAKPKKIAVKAKQLPKEKPKAKRPRAKKSKTE